MTMNMTMKRIAAAAALTLTMTAAGCMPVPGQTVPSPTTPNIGSGGSSSQQVTNPDPLHPVNIAVTIGSGIAQDGVREMCRPRFDPWQLGWTTPCDDRDR
jgi:hypothetical protein